MYRLILVALLCTVFSSRAQIYLPPNGGDHAVGAAIGRPLGAIQKAVRYTEGVYAKEYRSLNGFKSDAQVYEKIKDFPDLLFRQIGITRPMID